CSLLTPPFLFRYTPPTALPTLSLHDALPIYPIPPYVVDFYCANARLIVEVDGFAHDNAERAARDALRDQALIEKGYDVLRLPASLILNDMEAALNAIVARAANPLHRACGTVPLPASGEDLQ